MVEHRNQGSDARRYEAGGGGGGTSPVPGAVPGPPGLTGKQRQGKFKTTNKPRMVIPGGRAPPAIATSQKYYNGDRVITRTEFIPVRPLAAGASPSPPNSTSPDSPQIHAGVRPDSRNASYPWSPQAMLPGRPQTSQDRRSVSLEANQQQQSRTRADLSLQRGSPSDSQATRPGSCAPSISPPPTPPEKDEYWKDVLSPILNARPGAAHVDSVLLPPPPESLMAHRANSLNRKNNTNLHIDVPGPATQLSPVIMPAEPTDAKGKNGSKAPAKKKNKKEARAEEKEKEKVKRKEKEAMQFEDGSGEIKHPTGRSAADVFTAKLVTKAPFFGRKTEKQNTESTPKPVQNPTMVDVVDSITLDSAMPSKMPASTQQQAPSVQQQASSQQPTAFVSKMYPFNPTAGSFMAELPGSAPRPGEKPPAIAPERAERAESPMKKPAGKGARNSERALKKKKEARAVIPPSLENDHVYERMPLPAVPPSAPSDGAGESTDQQLSLRTPSESNQAKQFRMTMTGDPTADTAELADWLDTLLAVRDANTAAPRKASDDMSIPGSPHITVQSTASINPSTRDSILNPLGAVTGMYFTPHLVPRSLLRARNVQSRALSAATSDWGTRTSYASSMGDAFQYESEPLAALTGPSLSGPWDSGLGPITEFENAEEEAEAEALAELEAGDQTTTMQLDSSYSSRPLDTFRSGHFSPDFFDPNGYDFDAISSSPDTPRFPVDAGTSASRDDESQTERDDDDVDSAYGEDYLDDDRSSVASAEALQSQIEAILAKRQTIEHQHQDQDQDQQAEEEEDDILDDYAEGYSLYDYETEGSVGDDDDLGDGIGGQLDSEIDAILQETERAQQEDAQLRSGAKLDGRKDLKIGGDDLASPLPLPAVAYGGRMPGLNLRRASESSVEALPAVAYRSNTRESNMSVEALPAVAMHQFAGALAGGVRASRDSYGSVRSFEIEGMRFGDAGHLSDSETVGGGSRYNSWVPEALPAVAYSGMRRPSSTDSYQRRSSSSSIAYAPASGTDMSAKRATVCSLDGSDIVEAVGRKTRYIAGRNSELGTDIIFCLKSSELKSPGLPPPLPFDYGIGYEGMSYK